MEKQLPAAAQSRQLYTLNGLKPQPCNDLVHWNNWMSDAPLPVERTPLPNGRQLVTSFAGYAGERRQSQPCTFYTAIKPEPDLPEFSTVLEWHFTWEEAKECHRHLAQTFARPSSHSFSTRKRR